MEVLTGAFAIVAALLGLTAAIIRFRLQLKADALEAQARLQEIHVLVNDRMTEALKRIDQLAEALAAAGVEIPDTPERV